MKNTLGYTGAYKDAVTGGHPLGNGYRTYLPGLMRFCAPDNSSPFSRGGINPYTYCEADPINRSDPSGHFSVEDFAESLAKEVISQATKEVEAAKSLAARSVEEPKLAIPETFDKLAASERSEVISDPGWQEIPAELGPAGRRPPEPAHFDFYPASLKRDNSYEAAVTLDLYQHGGGMARLSEAQNRINAEFDAALALTRHHAMPSLSWQLGGIPRKTRSDAEHALAYVTDAALQLRSVYREARFHVAPQFAAQVEEAEHGMDWAERYSNNGRLLPYSPAPDSP